MKKPPRGWFRRAAFFIGWVLSPLSFWNDAFVNIPLAYITASICVRVFPVDFSTLVIIAYWITNGLGIWLMYLGGEGILRDRYHLMREIGIIILTIALYSIGLYLLARAGLIKPL